MRFLINAKIEDDLTSVKYGIENLRAIETAVEHGEDSGKAYANALRVAIEYLEIAARGIQAEIDEARRAKEDSL